MIINDNICLVLKGLTFSQALNFVLLSSVLIDGLTESQTLKLTFQNLSQ